MIQASSEAAFDSELEEAGQQQIKCAQDWTLIMFGICEPKELNVANKLKCSMQICSNKLCQPKKFTF